VKSGKGQIFAERDTLDAGPARQIITAVVDRLATVAAPIVPAASTVPAALIDFASTPD